jgi:hypothetical protein
MAPKTLRRAIRPDPTGNEPNLNFRIRPPKLDTPPRQSMDGEDGRVTLLQQAPIGPLAMAAAAEALATALSTFLSVLNRRSHGAAGHGEPLRRLMAKRVFALWDAAMLHQALSPDQQRQIAIDAGQALARYRREMRAIGADVATFDRFIGLLGADVPWPVALDGACVPAAVSRFVAWRMMPWDHGRLAHVIGKAGAGGPGAHRQALAALTEARAAQRELWAGGAAVCGGPTLPA